MPPQIAVCVAELAVKPRRIKAFRACWYTQTSVGRFVYDIGCSASPLS